MMSDSSKHVASTAWLLFLTAIVLWGVNWPLMKMGLVYLGPLWFAAIRVLVATVFIFAFLSLQGRLTLPTRDELPVLFSIGILQTGVFLGLIHSALLFVEAGRSAVLAYTTPLWTAPLALLFLREVLTPRKLAGIFFGVGGIVVMFNPVTFPWGWNGYTLGNGLLITAAMVWAGVIVHVRGHGWTRPHLSLLPWQFLLGTVVLLPVAFAVEGLPRIPASLEFAAIMGFNGIAATALSFWAFIAAARSLPANTTAMASLGVPVVGIFTSLVIIGEMPSKELLAGLSLIAIGQVFFHRPKARPLMV